MSIMASVKNHLCRYLPQTLKISKTHRVLGAGSRCTTRSSTRPRSSPTRADWKGRRTSGRRSSSRKRRRKKSMTSTRMRVRPTYTTRKINGAGVRFGVRLASTLAIDL